jgi:hypothetical protein
MEYDKFESVQNWLILQIGAISKDGSIYTLKMCLPLDEQLVPLVSMSNEPCGIRITETEQERIINDNYLNQIRTRYLFNREDLQSSSVSKPQNIYQKQESNIVSQPVVNQENEISYLRSLTKEQLIQIILNQHR